MIRFIAKIVGKWSYIFKQEREAAMSELSARVADKNAALSRDIIAQLEKDADEMEARIAKVAEMEEKGFWQCENGHEEDGSRGNTAVDSTGQVSLCHTCDAPKKFIKRSEMTGQEKYESDKDRKDAEKLIAAKREEIEQRKGELENQVNTASVLRRQAQGNRMLADKLREV